MESKLVFVDYPIPAANIGPNNPLPDMGSEGDLHSDLSFDDSVPKEERGYFTYGRVHSILPYLIQDGYDRNKKERAFKAAVLENDYLKAVFLPEIGGRLWSLYDKVAGRELMYKNPVFQPANLALRNAWFSGGVEWNIGMTGHTPYTCSPLFVAQTDLEDGTPVLRMYEWERVRRVSYQIDAYLPADSHFLFVRIKLCNTQDKETPMYWWSNIAVPEAEDVRVIAPAESAYWFDYNRIIAKRAVPEPEGIDRSYTTRVPHAMDTFFDIEPQRRKWVTALDGNGFGLLQSSTDRLIGRKLFMWGNGSGGRHWQEFLSEPGNGGYLEIQAGLAKTQMQHIPMPALAQWDWLEAYGSVAVEPAKVHGAWTGAYEAVEAALEKKLPKAAMDAEFKRAAADLNSAKAVQAAQVKGSGWAALEKLRLGKANKSFPADGLAFDESSINEEQQPWLDFLNDGILAARDPAEAPAAFLVQEEWRQMLQESLEKGQNNNWHAWLQLGIMHQAARNTEAARSAFEKSVSLNPSAWAYRNLSVLSKDEKAKGYMKKAVELNPILAIALEYSRLLLQDEEYKELVAFVDACTADVQNNWRMQVMKAQATIHLEDFDTALSILKSDLTVCDMREGEVLLSDLWIQLHKKMLIRKEGAEDNAELEKRVLKEFPLPKNLDFRMST